MAFNLSHVISYLLGESMPVYKAALKRICVRAVPAWAAALTQASDRSLSAPRHDMQIAAQAWAR